MATKSLGSQAPLNNLTTTATKSNKASKSKHYSNDSDSKSDSDSDSESEYDYSDFSGDSYSDSNHSIDSDSYRYSDSDSNYSDSDSDSRNSNNNSGDKKIKINNNNKSTDSRNKSKTNKKKTTYNSKYKKYFFKKENGKFYCSSVRNAECQKSFSKLNNLRVHLQKDETCGNSVQFRYENNMKLKSDYGKKVIRKSRVKITKENYDTLLKQFLKSYKLETLVDSAFFQEIREMIEKKK